MPGKIYSTVLKYVLNLSSLWQHKIDLIKTTEQSDNEVLRVMNCYIISTLCSGNLHWNAVLQSAIDMVACMCFSRLFSCCRQLNSQKHKEKCVCVYTQIPKPGTETGAPSNRPILVCSLLFPFQLNTETNTGSEALWIFWPETMDNIYVVV